MEKYTNNEQEMSPQRYNSISKSLANSQRKAALPRKLKSLFDSDYVKPDSNFRVKQDCDPSKVATQQSALRRYEEDLVKNKSTDVQVFHDIMKQQSCDMTQIKNEHDIKKTKQTIYNEEILGQINKNVSFSFVVPDFYFQSRPKTSTMRSTG